MAYSLDARFFRKAKKLNRAVEITDTEAFIPAVKESPEIRVALPVRREKTFEERSTEVSERMDQIGILEAQIEAERKALLDLVTAYRTTRSGVAEVVSQNLKVKGLMEKRSVLSRPEKWIEELRGLNFKDVFASKRDQRKIGADVYQVKRRVEPISSLYIDLEPSATAPAAAPATAPEPEAEPAPTAAPAQAVPKTTKEVAKGVIIGKVLKRRP
jgi:hypothetical protein